MVSPISAGLSATWMPAAFKAAGIHVAESPALIGETMARALQATASS